MEWVRYLDMEVNGFHREDFYWAQIAAELRRGNVKNPRKVRVKDFVLSFKLGDSDQTGQSRDRTERSKSFWLGLVGVKEK